MTDKSEYDVFLCHNSKEKQEVERIRHQLKQRGIQAWLDKYDFEPFRPWQEQLEEIIPDIKAAAVFIGSSGVGPWANIEMREFLVEFASRKIRMGLVILPGCPEKLIQQVPRFIKGFHWVDFRQQVPEPMEQLIWGITGRKPEPKIDPGVEKQEPQSDDLSSEKGINYTKLQKLLKAEKWKEADRETTAVMLKVAGQEPRGYLFNEDIEEFPCMDLRTIDQLWVKYSIGRFGFSVQKRIFDSVNRDGGAFGERVGWRSSLWGVFAYAWKTYDQITFNLGAPEGHLPFRIVMGGEWMDWGMRISLFSRRDL